MSWNNESVLLGGNCLFITYSKQPGFLGHFLDNFGEKLWGWGHLTQQRSMFQKSFQSGMHSCPPAPAPASGDDGEDAKQGLSAWTQGRCWIGLLDRPFWRMAAVSLVPAYKLHKFNAKAITISGWHSASSVAVKYWSIQCFESLKLTSCEEPPRSQGRKRLLRWQAVAPSLGFAGLKRQCCLVSKLLLGRHPLLPNAFGKKFLKGRTSMKVRLPEGPPLVTVCWKPTPRHSRKLRNR